LLFVTKLQKLFDMTKPRLAKVRALFYVFQQVIKKRLRLFWHSLMFFMTVRIKPRHIFIQKKHWQFTRIA